MKRIPPELDNLMWGVAENPTDLAIEEFGKRYPAHRVELYRRIRMVEGLRTQAKPGSATPRSIPAFQPRQPSTPVGLRSFGVATVLGLAALAAAGYTVFNVLQPSRVEKPRLMISKQEPPSQPLVRYQNELPKDDLPSVTKPAPGVKDESSPQHLTPAYLEKKASFKVEDVNLTDALDLIVAGTGIQLEIAPGFVDQKVTIEFHDKNPIEMLEAMAKQYAFTVSDEGQGNFLVVPVPDTSDSASGKRSLRVGP